MDALTNQALTPAAMAGSMPQITPLRQGAIAATQGGALCRFDYWIANNPALAAALTVGALLLLNRWRGGTRGD
jgi:hypothetical protein